MYVLKRNISYHNLSYNSFVKDFVKRNEIKYHTHKFTGGIITKSVIFLNFDTNCIIYCIRMPLKY